MPIPTTNRPRGPAPSPATTPWASTPCWSAAPGGEEGEILNPALDTPEVRADIAGVRRREELARATAIIGYDEVVHARLPRLGDGRLGGQRPPGLLRPGPPGRGGRAPGGGRPPDPAPGHGHLRRRAVRLPPPRPPPGPRDRAGRLPGRRRPGRFPEAGAPWQPRKLYYTIFSAARFREIHEKFEELGLESPFDEEWRERWDVDARARRPPRRSTSPSSPTSAGRPCWPTPPRSTRSRRSGSGCPPR